MKKQAEMRPMQCMRRDPTPQRCLDNKTWKAVNKSRTYRGLGAKEIARAAKRKGQANG